MSEIDREKEREREWERERERERERKKENEGERDGEKREIERVSVKGRWIEFERQKRDLIIGRAPSTLIMLTSPVETLPMKDLL